MSLVKHTLSFLSILTIPYCIYSYAGAKVALLRKLYPETVFGAIASSAVTAAIVDYWKYFEAIRLHADQECVHAIIESVS